MLFIHVNYHVIYTHILQFYCSVSRWGLSYLIFWPFCFLFYSSFKFVLLSYSLKFLHFYFTIFYQFISRHSTYLYLSILSVRFANILLVFSQIFIRLNLIFIFSFYNVSLLFSHFTRFYRLSSLVVSDEISAGRLLWSTSFGSEGTILCFYFTYLFLFILF